MFYCWVFSLCTHSVLGWEQAFAVFDYSFLLASWLDNGFHCFDNTCLLASQLRKWISLLVMAVTDFLVGQRISLFWLHPVTDCLCGERISQIWLHLVNGFLI